jgi:glycosyltransferase involved in cell wall biosynthesis
LSRHELKNAFGSVPKLIKDISWCKRGESMSKKMILITNLDVWWLTTKIRRPGTGNQSLYNTLLGYANAGWEIHMMTTSLVLSGMPSIHENVFIHRQPILIFEIVGKLKTIVKKLLRLLKPDSGSGSSSVRTTSLNPVVRLWIASRIFRWVMGWRAAKLSRKLEGVEFVYGYEVLGALAGRVAADKLGVPLITRFQGTELGQFLDNPEKLLSYKTKVEATRTKADLIIMANDGTFGDKVLDFLGVPKEKYRFYMNGVVKDDVHRPDVDVAQIRKQAHVPNDNLFLLYTGRFFYFKRIDRLLRVFAKALEQYPKMNLVLIGDGPEKKPCENLSRELGLADNIRFLEALPHSDVMDYLNACDIYAAFYDLSNLSNSMIEACVCGKCIVTSDVGGTTDLLTDGINAVVVKKYDDVEALSQGLLKVVADPAERVRLSEGARRRGVELKTWEQRMQMEVEEVEGILRVGRNNL